MRLSFKFFCVVLAAFITMVAAQDSLALEVSPGSVSANPGDSIVVPINISDLGSAIEVDAFGFTVNFDTSVLTFTSANKAGTLTDSFTDVRGEEVNPGELKVSGLLFGDVVTIDADGVLVNIEFTVNSDASSNSAISLTAIKDDISSATTTDGEVTLGGGINQKPFITLMGDDPMTLKVGDTYTEPGATAEDPEDGDISGNIVTNSSEVDTSNAGSYSVTYNVTDFDGLPADEVTRTVEVVANQKPVITLNGSNPMNLMEGEAYNEPGATAQDPEDGDISADIVIDNSAVDTSTAGNYTVTYNVTDSGDVAADEKTRDVVVSASDTPVASDDTLEVDRGMSKVGELIATDPKGTEALTYSVVTDPTKGSITNFDDSAGTYTYTPTDATYVGSDSFTFKANDGTDDSNVAPVSIEISCVKGDVDAMGDVADPVTIMDALMVAEYDAGKIEEFQCPDSADVDEDGYITIFDALAIAIYDVDGIW